MTAIKEHKIKKKTQYIMVVSLVPLYFDHLIKTRGDEKVDNLLSNLNIVYDCWKRSSESFYGVQYVTDGLGCVISLVLVISNMFKIRNIPTRIYRGFHW